MTSSVFFMALVVVAMGSQGVTSQPTSTPGITPSKGLIILTREAWGCLRGQKVSEDVSDKIAEDNEAHATIYEIKNPEDVFNRYELYLLFPAKSVNGLPGDLVVKLWCDNDKPEVKASLSLNQAQLYSKGDQWFLSLKLKGNGFVYGQVLYSRKPEIRQAWFSCPEAGDHRLYQLNFFSVYLLEGPLGGLPQEKLSGEWQTLQLEIGEATLNQMIKVDRCQAFLDILEREFAEPHRPLVWKRQAVDAEAIRALAKEFVSSQRAGSFDIHLKMDDRTEINVGTANFLPHLRQKLSLENSHGKLLGAELLLRARSIPTP